MKWSDDARAASFWEFACRNSDGTQGMLPEVLAGSEAWLRFRGV